MCNITRSTIHKDSTKIQCDFTTYHNICSITYDMVYAISVLSTLETLQPITEDEMKTLDNAYHILVDIVNRRLKPVESEEDRYYNMK